MLIDIINNPQTMSFNKLILHIKSFRRNPNAEPIFFTTPIKAQIAGAGLPGWHYQIRLLENGTDAALHLWKKDIEFDILEDDIMNVFDLMKAKASEDIRLFK